ncbi:MAG TPA: hypothetical protein VD769_07690 [Gaiellaceae bacterium]|nr:hypothetical protein [Gaiellaceae bacterium]
MTNAAPPTTAEAQPLVVRNETADEIRLTTGGTNGAGRPRSLVIAPFESVRITDQAWTRFGAGLRQLAGTRQIALLRATESETDYVRAPFVVLWVFLLVGLLLAGVAVGSTSFWVVLAAVAVPMAVVAVWQRNKIPASGATLIYLALVIGIGAGLPALALYFGANVRELIEDARTSGGEAIDVELLGRILQWLFVSLASILPAGLFFLFDRIKLQTLRETFERDMLRFDPSMSTLSDVRSQYGSLMAEAFPADPLRPALEHVDIAPCQAGSHLILGTESGRPARSHILPDRRLPVVIATLLITIGWIFTVLNPELGVEAGAFMLNLLEPQPSPIVFAFLGAYMFTLMALLRAYVRSDLRPKTYTHATARIIVAVISAWVLELLFIDPVDSPATTGNEGLLVLAFVIGFFPETLFVRLQEVAREFAHNHDSIPGFYERHPLTEIIGIDIYDRSRLLDEGIGNIEGLAHHNLPALMLQTRIPVGRIVHWTDQAILYLYVASGKEIDGPKADEKLAAKGERVLEHVLDEPAAEGPAEPESAQQDFRRRLRTLQSYGIYTATDLLRAFDARGTGKTAAAFETLLDDAADKTAPHRLPLIVGAIRDEQWIDHLLCWHKRARSRTRTIKVPASGGPPVEPELASTDTIEPALKREVGTERRAVAAGGGDGRKGPTVAGRP